MKRRFISYGLIVVTIGLIVVAMFTFAPFAPKTRYAKAINLTRAFFGLSDRSDGDKWFKSERQTILEKASKTSIP